MRRNGSAFETGVIDGTEWFLTRHGLAIVDDGFVDTLLQLIFRGRVLCARSAEIELRFFFGQGFNIGARASKSRHRWIPLQQLLLV